MPKVIGTPRDLSRCAVNAGLYKGIALLRQATDSARTDPYGSLSMFSDLWAALLAGFARAVKTVELIVQASVLCYTAPDSAMDGSRQVAAFMDLVTPLSDLSVPHSHSRQMFAAEAKLATRYSEIDNFSLAHGSHSGRHPYRATLRCRASQRHAGLPRHSRGRYCSRRFKAGLPW